MQGNEYFLCRENKANPMKYLAILILTLAMPGFSGKAVAAELLEVLLEGSEEEVVVVGFSSSGLDFLLEFVELIGVGTLGFSKGFGD